MSKRIKTISVAEIRSGDSIETVSGLCFYNVMTEPSLGDETQITIRDNLNQAITLGASIGVYLIAQDDDCQDCGKDCTEDLMAAAYDRAKALRQDGE